MSTERTQLSADEVQAQGGAELPDKEAMSLLDVNADLDLALDIAAPIDAAVGANVLSFDSTAAAVADQDSIVMQNLEGEAIANATQDATIDQGEG